MKKDTVVVGYPLWRVILALTEKPSAYYLYTKSVGFQFIFWNIIPPKSLRFLSQYFKFGDILNLCPFAWNSRAMRFSWSASKLPLFFFLVALLVSTLDSAYGTIVLIRIFRGSEDATLYVNMKLKIMSHVLSRLGALALLYFMICFSNANISFLQPFTAH
jgi:hypothetical protein